MQTRSKDYSTIYVKGVDSNKQRNGFPYRKGKNTDAIPFDPNERCGPGGLYFTDVQNVFHFINYADNGGYLAIVRPIGDVVRVENKFKSHELWVDQFMTIKEAVKWLVSNGADVTTRDNLAVRWVAEKGHLETVKFLVSQGADITARDNLAVICAAQNGHFETVKWLVSHGADVTARDNLAVIWASQNGHFETVKWLVSQGADVKAQDNYAVRWAARNGHLETFKFLVSQGADANS